MMQCGACELMRLAGGRSHPDDVQASWCNCSQSPWEEPKLTIFRKNFKIALLLKQHERSAAVFPLSVSSAHRLTALRLWFWVKTPPKVNWGATTRPGGRRFAAKASETEGLIIYCKVWLADEGECKEEILTRICKWNVFVENRCGLFWKPEVSFNRNFICIIRNCGLYCTMNLQMIFEPD